MSRNPAAKGRADSNQLAIKQAIRMLGFPVMDLSHAGNGVEDLLVGLRRPSRVGLTGKAQGGAQWWLLVECKVIERESTGYVRYKLAQKAWREKTLGWPRITVTSAQNAVDQIRELTR